MNRLLSTLVFTLLPCLISVAYGNTKPLANNQFDQISAGSALATRESGARDTTSDAVDVGGTSLNVASSPNIVDAADSTVANGANVRSGDKLNNACGVKRMNLIAQEGSPRSCSPANFKVDSIEEDEQSLDDVSANAIATDNPSTTNKSTYSITLSGSAESNAKAWNIVNAPASMVEVSSCP